MGVHAKLLLAAAALWSVMALAPAPARAQVSYELNDVNNRQSRSGDVIADGDLNVVDPDTVTSTRVATGNGYSASIYSGSLNVDTQQWVDGHVTAGQTVHVQDYAGTVTALSAATGNTGEANSYNYGDVQAQATQAIGTRTIAASASLDAPIAEITDASVSSQAIGNSHGFTMVGGAHAVTSDQYSSAITQADTQGQLRYSSGTTNFSATATSNNITAQGSEGAEPVYRLTQGMGGDRTQASVLVGASNVQETNGTATAVANNISVSNAYHPLDVRADQTNDGYVRAEADMNATAFGSGSANAYGVGNSTVAGNVAADIGLDNDQTNDGAVQSFARFNGAGGYDASSSSVAMGNAVTGYACSDCGGEFSARNRQSSSKTVSAAASVTISGHNRSVVSSATAIGNSATFYNSQPGS